MPTGTFFSNAAQLSLYLQQKHPNYSHSPATVINEI